MKKMLLFILLIVCRMSVAQDLSLYQKHEFVSPKGNVPYRILFPENYDMHKKYPLVLFLHGSGERGNDNEKQLTHGARVFLTDEARSKFPCIVVFPQCATESTWGSVTVDRTKTPLVFDFNYTRELKAPLQGTIDLVKKIIKEEAVDKKRVYIAGLSMGGMGTFEAVYKFPKLFAAAMPICGGGDVKRYDKRVVKIPFWVFHGAVDAVVDVKYSREMVEKLKTIGASVKYSEYPGVNHNSWDNAFAEPDFLSWMFSNARK